MTGQRSAEVSLRWNEPLAVELTAAVQRGDAERLRQMLRKRPELARARIIARGDSSASRTLLHLFADWPGHRRNPQGIVAVLGAAGADLSAPCDPASVSETPLHWAASNDDVELVDALLDAGADINTPGCVINGLGPVANAAIFGGIRAGRRLVERGAVTNIYQAAALGFTDRVRAELAAEPAPAAERITAAFWAACGSGNRDIAELLLARGADVNWVGWGDKTALDQARDAEESELATWLEAHGAQPAAEFGAGSGERAAPGDGDREQAGFAPCFPTRDLRAALAHYERLGFTVMPDADGAVWGWARFGTAEVHFFLKDDHDPARTAAAADLSVADCDALARQWSATGVPGTSDPYDTPYGRREAVHVDLDNNLIRFGSPIPDPH